MYISVDSRFCIRGQNKKKMKVILSSEQSQAAMHRSTCQVTVEEQLELAY